jgi:hypothetical protein
VSAGCANGDTSRLKAPAHLASYQLLLLVGVAKERVYAFKNTTFLRSVLFHPVSIQSLNFSILIVQTWSNKQRHPRT